MLELSSGLHSEQHSDVSPVPVTTVVRCVKCGQKHQIWHQISVQHCMHYGDPLIRCIVLLLITTMSCRGQ